MERKLHLPEWVKDRFARQRQDEAREAANFLARMRAQAMEAARHSEAHMPRQHRHATKRFVTKMERRRIGKRTRLARRGKPTHNFRIHT